MITNNDIFLDQRKIAYLNSEGADQPLKSLIAEKGSESIKLETQVVITENGYQALDSFPMEDVGHSGFSLRGRS